MMHKEIHLENIMKTLQTPSTLTRPTVATHCNGTQQDTRLESHPRSARRNSHPLPKTHFAIPSNLARIRSVSLNESKPLSLMHLLSDVKEETESGISLAIPGAFYTCWSIY